MTTENHTNQHAIWLIVLIAMTFSLMIGPIQVDALPISGQRGQNGPGLYQLVCGATECYGGSRLCSIVRVPSRTPGLDFIYPCFEPSFPFNGQLK